MSSGVSSVSSRALPAQSVLRHLRLFSLASLGKGRWAMEGSSVAKEWFACTSTVLERALGESAAEHERATEC
jgi:hypothetical protein